MNTDPDADNMGGSANVRDADGGLTLVGTVTGVARTVTNNTVIGSLQVEAADTDGNNDGTLTVGANVNAGTTADLVAENDAAMFATLFMAVLDLGSGTLEFANCGHPPPLREG